MSEAIEGKKRLLAAAVFAANSRRPGLELVANMAGVGRKSIDRWVVKAIIANERHIWAARPCAEAIPLIAEIAACDYQCGKVKSRYANECKACRRSCAEAIPLIAEIATCDCADYGIAHTGCPMHGGSR